MLESKTTTPQQQRIRHTRSIGVQIESMASLPRCASTSNYEHPFLDATAKYFSPYTSQISSLQRPTDRYAYIYSGNNENLRRVATAPDGFRRFVLAEVKNEFEYVLRYPIAFVLDTFHVKNAQNAVETI